VTYESFHELSQGHILDFDVGEAGKLVGLSTSDKQLIFFFCNLSQRLDKAFHVRSLQRSLRYLPLHRLWISAGEDFNLRI